LPGSWVVCGRCRRSPRLRAETGKIPMPRKGARGQCAPMMADPVISSHLMSSISLPAVFADPDEICGLSACPFSLPCAFGTGLLPQVLCPHRLRLGRSPRRNVRAFHDRLIGTSPANRQGFTFTGPIVSSCDIAHKRIIRSFCQGHISKDSGRPYPSPVSYGPMWQATGRAHGTLSCTEYHATALEIGCGDPI
jgi:hypothetical protein